MSGLDARQLGKRGARLIQVAEAGPGGFPALKAFLPTPNDVPTIGWGHTKGVQMGMTCTLAQAEAWFNEDVADAVKAVTGLSTRTKCELSQSMFDALVSLVYNVGPGAVQSASTISDCLMDRYYFGAWRGFSLWIKQAHRPLRGLAIRRAAEMALFFEDPLP